VSTLFDLTELQSLALDGNDSILCSQLDALAAALPDTDISFTGCAG